MKAARIWQVEFGFGKALSKVDFEIDRPHPLFNTKDLFTGNPG